MSEQTCGNNAHQYVLAYDVGTTGIKTCLFDLVGGVRLIADAVGDYGLYLLENGGAEQVPDEWWDAMCSTTKTVLSDSGVAPDQILGMSFCTQMQAVVLVDEEGNALRNSMNYMDIRAREEIQEGIMSGGPRVFGGNVFKVLKSVMITKAAALSVKDPVWKYKWVEKNEPEIFAKVYKWLDAKDFLICRCCDAFIMTPDSAFLTMLYDFRDGKEGWSPGICKMFGVNMEHLPTILKSHDKAGELTEKAASQLGLVPGIPVFAGGGDVSLIAVGSGAVREGEVHMYMGTSGWVSTTICQKKLDLSHMIAGMPGADPEKFNFVAELETAGKCLEWVKNHLAMDEINVYLDKKQVYGDAESVFKSLYDYMMHCVKDVPPGSGGVIFTPWLHGNRCPFEDPDARGMFFNISLDTGKTELIHAVLEGICYHLRWQLEETDAQVKTQPNIRFVGGGALAPLTCQILADVCGRIVETVDSPQNVGSAGAAATMAVGLGIVSRLEDVKDMIHIKNSYHPDPHKTQAYARYYEAFKALHDSNKKVFHALNA